MSPPAGATYPQIRKAPRQCRRGAFVCLRRPCGQVRTRSGVSVDESTWLQLLSTYEMPR